MTPLTMISMQKLVISCLALFLTLVSAQTTTIVNNAGVTVVQVVSTDPIQGITTTRTIQTLVGTATATTGTSTTAAAATTGTAKLWPHPQPREQQLHPKDNKDPSVNPSPHPSQGGLRRTLIRQLSVA
ncbi:hypothetical protein BD779DRAFT_1796865 [Infundibulicybe gibba]|nr:hypothetical protein BD779DRAFT_1796865 [Infundibulicybe gibba]